MPDIATRLRDVAEADRGNLLTVSYSKLDLFSNCERRYEKKYKERKFTSSSSIPLEFGNILHKALEIKANSKIAGEEVDYESIASQVMDGCDEVTDKSKAHIFGINEIKERHSTQWFEAIEDGNPYETKVDLFLEKVLPTRMEDEEWHVKGAEVAFEFVYDDRVIFHGFIDRIDYKYDDEGNEILRVVDYKSSKKVFPDTKIKTPLQMIIYDLACLNMYGILPTYHEYDFIALDQKQTSEADGVCSRGYMTRGLKKIDRILNRIDECESDGEYPPSPTPLCYWCEFCEKSHSPFADDEYGGECLYYSLWKPDNKVFSVNVEYIPGEEPVKRVVF